MITAVAPIGPDETSARGEGIMEDGRSTGDDLRLQLAAARDSFARDAQAAAADARLLLDWRHHFRSHPWLYCGGAAAMGYLLVPRRRATQPQVVAPPASQPQAQAIAGADATVQSVAAKLAMVVLTMLARQSASYLYQHGLEILKARLRSRASRGRNALNPMSERGHDQSL